MLGFMTVSMLLSMWISNAGVTAMMIPIVDAVVDELFPVRNLSLQKSLFHSCFRLNWKEDDLEINDTVPYPDCIDVVIMNKENELHAKRKWVCMCFSAPKATGVDWRRHCIMFVL